MLRFHAWRWKRRHYSSDPGRPIQFGRGTLARLYRRWRASGGNPDCLALRYRAPVKIRKGHALDFARVCINSGVRSFAEAYGRLPRPVATWSAYWYALRPTLRHRIIRVFAARRLLDCRTRKARAAVNSYARNPAARAVGEGLGK
jgi:hypothetical protein